MSLMDMPCHIQNVVHAAAIDESEAAYRRRLWAVVLGLTPKRDGNQWCILYGENLQEGIAGFGGTPDAAMRDFEMKFTDPREQ